MVKNLTANAGDTRGTGSIPRSGRTTGGGHLAWRIPWREEPGGPQGLVLSRERGADGGRASDRGKKEQRE